MQRESPSFHSFFSLSDPYSHLKTKPILNGSRATNGRRRLFSRTNVCCDDTESGRLKESPDLTFTSCNGCCTLLMFFPIFRSITGVWRLACLFSTVPGGTVISLLSMIFMSERETGLSNVSAKQNFAINSFSPKSSSR